MTNKKSKGTMWEDSHYIIVTTGGVRLLTRSQVSNVEILEKSYVYSSATKTKERTTNE